MAAKKKVEPEPYYPVNVSARGDGNAYVGMLDGSLWLLYWSHDRSEWRWKIVDMPNDGNTDE